MKYPLCTRAQRIVSFLIDYAIIALIGGVISFFVLKFTGIQANYKSASESYYAIIYDTTATGDMVNAAKNDMLKAMLPRSGIMAVIFLVIQMIYLVALPAITEFQTLGRLVMKCRLRVVRTNEKPTVGKLFYREGIEYIIYILLTIIFTWYNIVIWLSAGLAIFGGFSVADRFARIKLTTLEPEAPIEFSDLDFEHQRDLDWEKMDEMEAKILAEASQEEEHEEE